MYNMSSFFPMSISFSKLGPYNCFLLSPLTLFDLTRPLTIPFS